MRCVVRYNPPGCAQRFYYQSKYSFCPELLCIIRHPNLTLATSELRVVKWRKYRKVLSRFNHELHDWGLYKGRLEQWFLANEVNNEVDKSGVKRRAILLSSLVEDTYRLIRDLALPGDVGILS